MTDVANATFTKSLLIFGLLAGPAIESLAAQTAASAPIAEIQAGPYAVRALAGGGGLVKPLPPTSEMLRAEGTWTLSVWIHPIAGLSRTLIAGVGNVLDEDSRVLGVQDGRPFLRLGADNQLAGTKPLEGEGWHLLAAISEHGHLQLYADGALVAEGARPMGRVAAQLTIAPAALPRGEGLEHFGGEIAGLSLLPEAMSAPDLRQQFLQKPDAALLVFEEASKPWPVQVRGQAGYLSPQDPSSMPHSRAAFSTPAAKAPPPSSASLTQNDRSTWVIRANWMLRPAPEVQAHAATLSTAGFDSTQWMRATMPGTVLSTMIDRGIYADPDFGLNNLAIPESLNKQDYWYRVEFPTPKEAKKRHTVLTFNGINYAAEVWLNGHLLGRIEGAFIRGSFEATPWLRADGPNALAVRISPPPHPGTPNEQSIKGGPGENGGALVLDGPTFVASEGWDWIPAIRDRNTGIWQDVVLTVTDLVRLGDPRVVTHLPLPDTTRADVEVEVPVNNLASGPAQTTVHASFEGVQLQKTVTLPPGETVVRFLPSEFPQLHLQNPRLWWPNGYGRPELYHLQLSLSSSNTESDHRELTFGIREITYELSLFDSTGRLRRVEVSPTVARADSEQIVDVRHQGMRQTAEYYAASLTAAGEHSSAVKTVTGEDGFTDLVLKVNGVRIAARGGNWGMDDSRKRVSREHLEPFFKLHQQANLNIIRNWVGQDTEETFFQLADEYGMMVWNDFWASTQDYNAEPQDVPLFLRNARDTVARFRNHPSIVIWCGRNEGVPQPILNEGLIRVFAEEDGTRYYTPGSNRINLRNSGPYRYQDPKLFYAIDKGFSVELGIASLSTIESLKASISEPDLWPIGDAWAYHDWHQSGNGDVAPLMQHIEQEFGAAVDLKDFERKAQMFNYVDHRAIFEGFNQHLWSPNSGRMLWMTQPAWPSNMWQILSSDYDTQASFYGVKKACEPLHVQLDLTDYTVTAVNTTNLDAPEMTVRAQVYSLTNQLLASRERVATITRNGAAPFFQLGLAPFFEREGTVLIRLQMLDKAGQIVSQNIYWLAGDEGDYRRLNSLAEVTLQATAQTHRQGDEIVTEIKMTNATATAALATKLTLVDAKSGMRILPAYYSDNYVSLLPGESTILSIRSPAHGTPQEMRIDVSGWNLAGQSIAVQ